MGQIVGRVGAVGLGAVVVRVLETVPEVGRRGMRAGGVGVVVVGVGWAVDGLEAEVEVVGGGEPVTVKRRVVPTVKVSVEAIMGLNAEEEEEEEEEVEVEKGGGGGDWKMVGSTVTVSVELMTPGDAVSCVGLL